MKNESQPSAFQKFDAAIRKIFTVSHGELKRREPEWKKQRKAKKLGARNTPPSPWT